jgi:hypothetical protein
MEVGREGSHVMRSIIVSYEKQKTFIPRVGLQYETTAFTWPEL